MIGAVAWYASRSCAARLGALLTCSDLFCPWTRTAGRGTFHTQKATLGLAWSHTRAAQGHAHGKVCSVCTAVEVWNQKFSNMPRRCRCRCHHHQHHHHQPPLATTTTNQPLPLHAFAPVCSRRATPAESAPVHRTCKTMAYLFRPWTTESHGGPFIGSS